MTTSDARNLIEGAVTKKEQSDWVDLGCGSGTFAYALAGLLDDGSRIFAVDRLHQYLKSKQGNVSIEFTKADFEKQELHFANLSGIVLANSLHYVEDQLSLILRIKPWLKEGGKIILIEYDTDEHNPWVPYPITFEKATAIFDRAGFNQVVKIGELSSRFRKEAIFSCVATL